MRAGKLAIILGEYTILLGEHCRALPLFVGCLFISGAPIRIIHVYISMRTVKCVCVLDLMEACLPGLRSVCVSFKLFASICFDFMYT